MNIMTLIAGALALALAACAPAAATAMPAFADILTDPAGWTVSFASLLAVAPAAGFGRKSAGQGADTDTDPAALVEGFRRATDEVKTLAEDLRKKYESGQAVTDEVKKKADDALIGMNALKARLEELEQKAARRGADEAAAKTWGEQVVESDAFKSFAAGRGKLGKVALEVKDISGVSEATGGALLGIDRRPGIIALPPRRMTIRDLLTPGRTAEHTIRYERETGFTNNARVVSEGATKPQSEITYESVTQDVATIAHWVRASKQILADVPMLLSTIDQRLRYGLAFKEEEQLLNGDGQGENLEGLVTAAEAYNAPFTFTGMTMIDQIRLALLQAALAEYPATGVVMNPIDWTRIEVTKDETGRYIIGQPQGSAAPTLWGVPVVTTQSMAEDKFLAGAFQLGAQIFDREEATVQISDEDGDNFVRNKVTILAEERLALAIYRPEAFVYGDFGNVADE